jgi:ABC-type transporter Mla subunit MlaD
MKSTKSTHFKLGLFALGALAGLVIAGFGLGLRVGKNPIVDYHTYFDESVQGLEVGSPVKYRGVRIGSVSHIAIGPDRKHIDVELALDLRSTRRLDLATSSPALRAQLATQGITGVKFIDLDFFTGALPPLPFVPAPNYLPTRSSLFKGLEDNLESVTQRLPALMDRALGTFDRIDRVLDEARDTKLVTRIATLVDRATVAVADVDKLVAHVDRAKLPEHASATLDRVDRMVDGARGAIEHVDGEATPLITSARRATDSIGDVGRTSLGAAEALEQTIRDLGEAARAFRELIETVERDPDILVKGRERSKHP